MRRRLIAGASAVLLLACGSPASGPLDAAAPADAGTADAGAPDAGAISSDAGAPTAPCDAFASGRTVGVTRCEVGAEAGYTLLSPIGTRATYLVDLDGRLVHQWTHALPPGQSVYLLEDGRLLRPTDPGDGAIGAGGQGGGVELVAWDGTVEWSFTYFDDTKRAHHDVAWLPSGNVVLIAWERVSEADARAAGRVAPLGAAELWPDHLVEVRPEPDGGATIVWEWHAWDHLVQSNDASLPTYGEPSEHPERIDVDFGGTRSADWLHLNSVAYDADHDQLILSAHNANEIWVIDHATSTEEARGPAGDLLYRWGNPAAWGAGTAADRRLYGQHDAHLIPAGRPGEDHLLVFNNGDMRDRVYSSVDELELPRAVDGTFMRDASGAWGPDELVWTFEDPGTFHSANISGAQRLFAGTTLVCEGANGRLFEITPDGDVVWEYLVPVGRAGVLPPGSTSPRSSVFRAYRYAADYPGLSGRDLTPGALLEETD
ncbi:MAG: aryl-sulfate sulfotransferase [Sandaracinaceae bacterium]|nr:aryl-sulfate sulfotransferase [Sandaracinaceae bacterium]